MIGEKKIKKRGSRNVDQLSKFVELNVPIAMGFLTKIIVILNLFNLYMICIIYRIIHKKQFFKKIAYQTKKCY